MEVLNQDPEDLGDREDLLVKDAKVDVEILDATGEVEVEEVIPADIKNMSKCIRCGKERIIKSSNTETLEKTTVTYTVTVCPDPECQKMVEKGLVVEENKRKIMHLEQEKRALELAEKRKRDKEAASA